MFTNGSMLSVHCVWVGPTEYNPKPKRESPAYSMARKYKPVEPFPVPDPGKYDIQSTIGTGRKTSLYRKYPPHPPSRTPAPCEYDVIKYAYSLHPHPAGFMTYRPFPKKVDRTPDACTYRPDFHPTVPEDPHFTMRPYTKYTYPECIDYPDLYDDFQYPGPADYRDKTNKMEKNDSPKWTMAAQHPDVNPASRLPSPNQYNAQKLEVRPEARRAPAFSLGPRRPVKYRRVGPGPGKYNLYGINRLKPMGTTMHAQIRPPPRE